MELTFLKSAGRLFHSCGANRQKALSPADLRFTARTLSRDVSEDTLESLGTHCSILFKQGTVCSNGERSN